MNSSAVLVLVFGGLAYAAYAVPAMFQFFAYCKQAATVTGQIAENASVKTNDDGGLNEFQREQYRMLRSGEFKNSGDAALVARGTVVARKLRVSFWAAIGLVSSVVAADLWAR